MEHRPVIENTRIEQDPAQKKESDPRRLLQMEFSFEMRDELKREFISYFKSNGFFVEQEAPLCSRGNDPTVVFTGSSTNVFKKYLEGEERVSIPQDGVLLYQHKIRTQNYGTLYDPENLPTFCSYFEGGGLLFPPGSYDRACKEVIDFLVEKLGLKEEDLMVRVTRKTPKMLGYWENDLLNSIKVEYDGYDEDEYFWGFGIDGLSGEGVVLSVHQQSGEYKDIGTIVVIDNKGQEVGVEWGFGTETMLSRIYGKPHPIVLSKISEIFSEAASSTETIKLADSVITSLMILDQGVKLTQAEKTAATTVLVRYLKGVIYFTRELGYTLQDLERWSSYLSVNYLQNKESSVIFMDYIKRRVEVEQRLIQATQEACAGDLRNFLKLNGVRKLVRETGLVNLVSLFQSYGFVSPETSVVVSSFKNNLDSNGNLLIDRNTL